MFGTHVIVIVSNTVFGDEDGEVEVSNHKVREMILDNQSDSEIYSFMVERYGEFVVYKPPVSPKTYLLWFAPLIALLLSLFYLFRSTRQKTNTEAISESDIEKAKKLLK